MEVITAQLQFLLWIFSPVGAVSALSLLALLVSGLPGRIVLNLEVSGSGHRPARRALEAASERIMK